MTNEELALLICAAIVAAYAISVGFLLRHRSVRERGWGLSASVWSMVAVSSVLFSLNHRVLNPESPATPEPTVVMVEPSPEVIAASWTMLLEQMRNNNDANMRRSNNSPRRSTVGIDNKRGGL